MARLRPATLDDALGIARVHVAAWQTAYAGVLSPALLESLDEVEQARRWVRRLREVYDAQVIQHGTRIIGFVTTAPCRDQRLLGFAGEIGWLYVDPRHWGQGHGRTLFEAASRALSKDFLWVVLWVLERNRAARAFYQRMGLQPTKDRYLDKSRGSRAWVRRYAGPLNPAIDLRTEKGV